jgi:hypothetical protein
VEYIDLLVTTSNALFNQNAAIKEKERSPSKALGPQTNKAQNIQQKNCPSGGNSDSPFNGLMVNLVLQKKTSVIDDCVFI